MRKYEQAMEKKGAKQPEMIVVNSESIDWTALKDVIDLQDSVDEGIHVVFANLPEVSVIRKNQKLRELLGIAEVKEDSTTVTGLDLYDNLMLGAFSLTSRAKIEENLKYVYSHFPRLEERKNQVAGTLSGGEQQMLAMGRALMSNPKIILMDEPSMGLSPLLVNEIFKIIKEVSKDGATVLLVEQNAKKALSIADRAYVLETGKIVMEGKAEDLLNDSRIRTAYLGE